MLRTLETDEEGDMVGDIAQTTTTGASSATLLIYLAYVVFLFASQWRLFTKAGQPGWAAIVPIYGLIVLLKIVGRPWWWIFLLFLIIPIFIVLHDLSKSFGKEIGFTIGLILLGIVFWPILAFGSATYQGPSASGGGGMAVPPPPPMPI